MDDMEDVTQRFLADVSAFVEDVQVAAGEARGFAVATKEATDATGGLRDGSAEAGAALGDLFRHSDEVIAAQREMRDTAEAAASELGHLRDEAIGAAAAQRDLARAERDAGRAAAETAGASGLGLLMTSLVAMAPAVIPMVAALVTGAAALGPALIGAAGGAFLFAQVARPAFEAVALSGKAQAKALAALPPSMRDLARELLGVKSAWAGFQTASGAEVAGGIAPWAGALKEVIGYLPSILGPAATAIRGLGEEARTALGSPFWRTFFDEVGKVGGLALRTFGEAAGHVATGLAHLAEDFIPVAQQILPVVDQLAGKFERWAESSKGSGAITNLINYVKTNGPQMVSVVKQLAQDIPNMVRALAGFGGGALSGISVILTVIGKLSPTELQAIAGAIIAIQLATKAWAIAQALLDVAMDANPIGAIVLAVVALVGGIAYLWTHSAAFRDFWEGAWRDIQKAVKPAVDFIKNVVGNLVTWWNQHWTEIHEVLRIAWALISGYVKTYIKIVQTEVKVGIALVGDIWKVAWGAIKDSVLWAWNVIKAEVTTAIKVIGDIIAIFLDVITGHWSKAWQDVKKLFHDAVNGIVSIAKAWASGFVRFFSDLGKNLVSGLINGIKSMFGGVFGVLGDLAHGISSTFSSVLHILSPSRVFFEHGRNTLLGYIQGIMAVAPMVHAAMASVGGHVAAGGLPGVAAGAPGYAAASTGRPTVNITANFAPGMQGYNDPRFLQYLQVQMQEAILRYNVNNPNNGLALGMSGGRL